MKKFYATLAMALATVIGASAAPVIYAYQTWQHGNDNSVTGPIKFDPETDPINVTLIADSQDWDSATAASTTTTSGMCK